VTILVPHHVKLQHRLTVIHAVLVIISQEQLVFLVTHCAHHYVRLSQQLTVTPVLMVTISQELLVVLVIVLVLINARLEQ
jgi:hypothetical protein